MNTVTIDMVIVLFQCGSMYVLNVKKKNGREGDKLLEVNKVYNNDCMNGFQQLENNSVQMILTDIPYGNVTKNGEERAKYSGQLRNINKGSADVETFDLLNFLDECYRVCEGTIYIFCGKEQVSDVFSYFSNKKDMMTRQGVWHKTNPSPSNGQYMWLDAIENCVFAKKRKQLFNEHCKHNVWTYPVERKRVHPTQKPLKLFEYLIEVSSSEQDIILDPCAGGMTTAIASINKGRQYICFEIDEQYYKNGLERIEQHVR